MTISKRALVYLFMTLAALASVVPFIWMLVTSLKTQAESIQIPLTLLPENPSLQAYGKIMREIPFADFLYQLAAGHLLHRDAANGDRHHGRVWLLPPCTFVAVTRCFLVCISILMVPGQAFLIPQFLVVQKMGLVNSITGLVLPGIFSIYATFLLRQFFLAVPKEMEEAALIDGYQLLRHLLAHSCCR
ncbi:glycerol-3-phosphate transporter membrane protein [Serratia fonticola]|uniref:Glycerol-3-phosphate transporter membrane protein n=1 Tax=Serratia fonticola TaxID=47917 RepID=A0A4U9W4Y3_SERFO|nr:glycerol-3-phosphate transporter membrane protein [Serratia fonticola]